MNRQFAELVDSLDAKYQELLAMPPVVASEVLGKGTPIGGVYLFSENGRHLYAGRTKRPIGLRIKDQVGANPSAASFAWLIAREATGKKATYKPPDSRETLLKDLEFLAAYENAKAQIRRMHVRYVHEPDPLRQALLEIYVAVATETKYNDFDTH